MSFSVKWRDLYFNVVTERGFVVKAFFSDDSVFSLRGDSGDRKFREQLEDYFNGKAVEFKIPVKLDVTPFTKRVLMEVMKIPYGKTVTYHDIATKLRTSPRAVGQALKRNPIPVIIPCHRIVAKNGLGGYSEGTKIKARLLTIEKINMLKP